METDILVWDEIKGEVSPVVEYNTAKEIEVGGMRPETCGLYADITQQDNEDPVTGEIRGWVAVHVIDFPKCRIVIEVDDRAHTAVWYTEKEAT